MANGSNVGERNADKKNDRNWWEFYIVRYFVGAVIGALVILSLSDSNSPFKVDQGRLSQLLARQDDKTYGEWYGIVLAIMGLTYCYLASAPILAMHALRGLANKRFVVFKDRKKVATLTVLAILGMTSLTVYNLWEHYKNIQDLEFWTGCIVHLTFFTFSFLFTALIFIAVTNKNADPSFEYYKKLAQKRALASSAGEEYIESYRHLREHGNAFLIVLAELFLALALYFSTVPWAYMMIIWVLPAAFVWSFGTRLENLEFPK